MCNLYNVTTTREAVRALTGAMDRSGWNEPSRDVYPGMLAPIVRAGQDGVREMIMATWGMLARAGQSLRGAIHALR
jgi:putative SOS response-associated peptidase YedK